MKPYILPALFALTWLLLLNSCSENQTRENNTFPMADAVYKELLKEYTLNPNGTIEFRHHQKIEYLTHNAFHSLYGETFIPYNPAYWQLKINKCQTVMANGKTVVTPKNAFNEVLPSFARNSGAYNHLREMVVTHTGLEVNAVSELDYTLISSEEYLKFLTAKEYLTESSPIENLTIRVKVPADQSLKYSMIRDSILPSVKTDDKWKTYEWTFRDVPADAKDHHKDGVYNALVFSTDTNDNYTNSFLFNQEAFDFYIEGDLKQKVSEITKAKRDTIDLLLALQEIVVNEVNYRPIPFSQAAYRIRTPMEVWRSNEGSEADKTLLLMALIKEAGFDPQLVQKSPMEAMDATQTCILPVLSHLFVTIKMAGDIAMPYLSALELNEPFVSYSNEEAMMILDENKIDASIVFSTNQVFLEGTLTFTPQLNLSGSAQGHFTMACNPFRKLKNKITGQSLLNGAASAEIVKSTPAETYISFNLSNPEPFVANGPYYFWKVPLSSAGTEAWHMNVLPAERNSVFKMPHRIKEEYKYAVSIPQGYEIVSEETLIEEACETVKIKLSFGRTEEGFKIERKLEVTDCSISPSDYEKTRDILLKWLNPKYREVIIKKTESATQI